MRYGVHGRSLDSSDGVISGSTQVYGVLGYPISHSLSPAIQNAAFRFTGLNAVYVAFPVEEGRLRPAIQGLKSLRVKGLNVTTPHKMVILRYLDKVETEAAEIGAINTVKNDDDTLIGFNTDGIGALDAIKDAGESADGQNVLLFGAGGAARAIAYALARHRCSLALANRTASSARRLQRELYSSFGVKVQKVPLSKQAIHDCVNKANIILNASSMGMDAKSAVPIDRRWIRANHLVFDIVYRPVETKLLQDAASVGARTINGLDMLLNQAVRSFTIWTGMKAPIHEMRRAIPEKLIVQNATDR